MLYELVIMKYLLFYILTTDYNSVHIEKTMDIHVSLFYIGKQPNIWNSIPLVLNEHVLYIVMAVSNLCGYIKKTLCKFFF